MFQPFICGAFDHQEEDDHKGSSTSSPNSTPRKSRRNRCCKSKSHNNKDDKKNPYSNRGLDKFSALLAELEEKRQKIYSQTGSQDISLGRFLFKDSTDYVPIVVKLKDKKEEVNKKPVDHTTIKLDHQPSRMDPDSEVLDKQPIETLSKGKEVMKNKIPGLQSVSEKTEKMKKKSSFSWRHMEFHKWRRPSYYLPSVLVLILLLLVFFGRSVSILFTCIGWYMVPLIPGESSNKMTTSMKRRVYARKSSQIRDHHRKS